MSTNRSAFGATTTTEEALDGIDLHGHLALVTGASTGLGAETARALAARGANLVLAVRDVAKGTVVADSIHALFPDVQVAVEKLELDSLASIRAFAERFCGQYDALQLLINNAGIMACAEGRTRDGFETQFGTNHVGHFLLTNLLVPALLRGAPARIVTLSSRGHHMSPVVFDDVAFERRPYDPWAAYGQSKTANILFSVELDRRLADRGVRALAVHPGVIHTELSRHMDADTLAALRARLEASGTVPKTVAQGAATSVYAATAPELDGQGGCYLEDCGVAAVTDAADATRGVRSYALDGDAAQQLWSLSESLVGQTFEP